MKKPKRSSQYEEQNDPMRDLNIEVENPDDDDDVIDLEDIIEMPDSPIDEDEDLDLDVEIFDVDSDLEPETEKAAQMSSEEKDLIESLGNEPEEDETLFQSPAAGVEPHLLDDVESLLDDFMDEPAGPQPVMGPGKKPALNARAAEEMKVVEESLLADVEPEAGISDESPVSSMKAGAPLRAPASAVDLTEVVEELIGRIESRLQEHVRGLVQSMLPELVRATIEQEVEKLKKELDHK